VFGGLDALILPTSYVSGTFLSATDTYDSTTIAALGLTPGTYTYTWGIGPHADSLVLYIVPKPASFVLMRTGLVGRAVHGWRRRRSGLAA
jgi:hypothetical protein